MNNLTDIAASIGGTDKFVWEKNRIFQLFGFPSQFQCIFVGNFAIELFSHNKIHLFTCLIPSLCKENIENRVFNETYSIKMSKQTEDV